MIRLKHPANMNGVLVPAGTVMQMDPELAQKFISAGTAEVFMPDPAVELEPDEDPETETEEPEEAPEAETSADETAGEQEAEAAEESAEAAPEKTASFGRPGRRGKAGE